MLRVTIKSIMQSVYRLVYIGDVFAAKSLAKATCDSHYLLALATLGGMKEIGSFPLAKVSK
jgi:hypothetical protein